MHINFCRERSLSEHYMEVAPKNLMGKVGTRLSKVQKLLRKAFPHNIITFKKDFSILGGYVGKCAVMQVDSKEMPECWFRREMDYDDVVNSSVAAVYGLLIHDLYEHDSNVIKHVMLADDPDYEVDFLVDELRLAMRRKEEKANGN